MLGSVYAFNFGTSITTHVMLELQVDVSCTLYIHVLTTEINQNWLYLQQL